MPGASTSAGSRQLNQTPGSATQTAIHGDPVNHQASGANATTELRVTHSQRVGLSWQMAGISHRRLNGRGTGPGVT
jgi:hypothetical protein